MPTSHKILLSLKHVLSKNNTHERDQNLKFYEEGHKYVILTDSESKYTSVTTWNHSHFSKFEADKIIKNMMSGKNWKEGHKYWGLTAEQINALWANNATSASGAGTNMHYEIECFMNNDSLPAGYTHKELYDAYIAILEAKYDKKVTDLYLVRLHPDAEETNYELIKVPDLSADILTLFKELNNR